MNSVNIIGHLTSDPSYHSSGPDSEIANLRIAINSRRGKPPVFTDVKAFGKLAAALCDYLYKGSKIAISGRLAFDEWDKDGQKHTKVYVIANTVDFLNTKASDQEPASEPESAEPDRAGVAEPA